MTLELRSKLLLARVALTAAAFVFLLSPIGVTTVHAKTLPTPITNVAPAVKKSVSKICHAKGTRYYSQTKRFTAYKTLKDCIKSGGRLPK